MTDEMQRAMSHYYFFSRRWLGIRLGIIYTVIIVIGYLLPILFIVLLDNYFFEVSTLNLAISFSWNLKVVNFLNAFI